MKLDVGYCWVYYNYYMILLKKTLLLIEKYAILLVWRRFLWYDRLMLIKESLRGFISSKQVGGKINIYNLLCSV